jgi:hypothetical protein
VDKFICILIRLDVLRESSILVSGTFTHVLESEWRVTGIIKAQFGC